MTVFQRIKKLINWLIFMEYAESEKDLADKLGYTKSGFSQIVNGRVPLADRFVKKLCALDENINEVWIISGSGSMLKVEQSPGGDVTISKDVWAVIKAQAESLKSKDKQIDELLLLLKQQIIESKKTDARQEGNASSAVAV